tara:strand:- start:327 stop:974 length:648 start_codon:yes stop_codon:yes gene_type:complete
MFYRKYELFTKKECDFILEKLYTCNLWQDGRLSTGVQIKDRKNNNELKNSDLLLEINNIIFKKMFDNKIMFNDILFNIVLPVIINKYETNEYYGWHYDSTFMPNSIGKLSRMDYSFTIFLNDNYEGGELQIVDKIVKGKQGQIIIYDNKLRHQVHKIKKGIRYAAFGWMQSLIEDIEIRKRCSKNFKYLDNSKNLDSPEYLIIKETTNLLLKKFM